MTNILRKFTVAVTGAVVGFGLTGVNSAQAASLNFSLSFFDSTNSLVGEGSFSYDGSTPYQDTILSSFSMPPLEIKASNQWFALTSFSATVWGKSWDLSKASSGDRGELLSPLLWAPFDTVKTRFVFDGKVIGSGVIPQLASQWAFGNYRILPALGIFGEGFGTGGGKISWMQSGGGQSNGKSVNTGYLIVEEIQPCHENSEAVPEPATVAGLGLAAAGLGAAKKKLAASKV
ncbi:MAG: PEP-CTERM sorting domain-containing protein [Oscillatoriales cyanobacterium]|uniref:PEP-CTERM sorting domain-containing protein n=1 Tax=Microcoleus anatoxicus TaxID=2705319 RepID=UPI0029714829|nr:MAG: PEP-CTERM sorting domain-containing protein [Oscillatoriales cyanobacterium]TAF71578.1 MAG: PEP-CTERM sorting domain-containing protein [Oscillatoriales cyanobacterium]